MRFTIEDHGASLAVRYQGTLPVAFGEDSEVMATDRHGGDRGRNRRVRRDVPDRALAALSHVVHPIKVKEPVR